MGLLDFETSQETAKKKGREEAEKEKTLKRFYIVGGAVLFVAIAALVFGLYARFLNPQLGERLGFGKTVVQIATTKRISSCVVLDERYCGKFVFQNNQADGSRLPRAGVTVPDETSVYAPYDGYFDYGARATDGEASRSVIFVYREEERTREGVLRGDYLRMSYIAPSWDYKKRSNEPVKKGDLIAVIKGEGGMFKSVVGENDTNLLIVPDRKWHEEDGVKINTPLDYLKSFITFAETKPLK